MPHINFDWTFNIGHIISVLVFVMAGVGAYYDVKSDIRVVNTKLVAVDTALAQQRVNDEHQDALRERIKTEIKEDLRDIKNDINQNIRDLRNDLFRKRVVN